MKADCLLFPLGVRKADEENGLTDLKERTLKVHFHAILSRLNIREEGREEGRHRIFRQSCKTSSIFPRLLFVFISASILRPNLNEILSSDTDEDRRQGRKQLDKVINLITLYGRHRVTWICEGLLLYPHYHRFRQWNMKIKVYEY